MRVEDSEREEGELLEKCEREFDFGADSDIFGLGWFFWKPLTYYAVKVSSLSLSLSLTVNEEYITSR